MVTDRQRFGDHLEVIKFICKEFWAELFQKQVDNLKTNHRVSSPSVQEQLLRLSRQHNLALGDFCRAITRPGMRHQTRADLRGALSPSLLLLQGVFVLQDNRFRWLHRLSPETTGLPKAQGESSSCAWDHANLKASSFYPCQTRRLPYSTNPLAPRHHCGRPLAAS